MSLEHDNLAPGANATPGPEDATAARILESITDAFFALDSTWRFTYLNSEAERLLRRPREQLLGRNVWEEFPAATGAAFFHEYHRAMEAQVTVAFEEYYPPPLDTWFEVRAYPSPTGLAVYFQDISDRKRAEEALRASLAHTEEVLESITDAFYALDHDYCFTYINRRSEELWGRPREEMLGRPLLAVLPQAQSSASWDAHLRAMEERRPFHFEIVSVVLHKWVDVSIYPTADGGLSVYYRDISERKALEAERERLLAEAQARAEREALMNRIGAAIRSSLDPAVIQETAAFAVGEALVADRCLYIRYDLLRNVAEVGRDWHRADLPSLEKTYRLSDFDVMLSELFPGGQTAVIEDVHAGLSPAIAAALEAFRHRAVLAVPYFNDGRLVAALFVSMADTPRRWTEGERLLVETAAEQTRTAVEAAQLSQREHRIATQLQEALVPSAPDVQPPGLSVAARSKPALAEAEVGGDFFDVFALDKQLYALVVGDVSGKGLAAAAQLALVRNSLRTTLYLYRSAGEAATNLNTILTAHDLLAGFVTAFVGIYDTVTGRLAYASCGHEPALLRRAIGTVESLGPTGPPLGVAEGARYGEGAATLKPGDALLVYTDGLSEAGPSRRDLLGTDGLTRLLESQEDTDAEAAADQIVAGVSAFAGGVFRDDICLLLACRRASP